MRVLTRGGAHFIDFPVGARQRPFLEQASTERAKNIDVERVFYALVGAEEDRRIPEDKRGRLVFRQVILLCGAWRLCDLARVFSILI